MSYGLDSNTRLLLHCDGADTSTDFPDESNGNHTVTAAGSAQVDTGITDPWGGNAGVLLLNGSGDSLSSPDSTDWDVFGDNASSWTIDLRVKHTDHAGSEYYIAHHENSNNRWYLDHVDGVGLRLWYISGGSNLADITGGEITDTNWHHVSVCLVSTGSSWNIGIYKDGTQIAYGTVSSEDTFAGSLYIGQLGDGSQWMDGTLDEIRIQNSNYFGASPNIGLTDTITEPTVPYSLAAEPAVQALALTSPVPTISISNPVITAISNIAVGLNGPDILLSTTYTASVQDIAVAAPAPSIRIDKSILVDTANINAAPQDDLNFNLPVTIGKYIYDPVVKAGCPQCGTYLYNTGRSVRSRAVNTGRNWDQGPYDDARFVRCARCGFVCNTDRDQYANEGSRLSWGITNTRVDATASGSS